MSKTTYKHLTHDDRWQIKALKESGKSARAIALQLGRSNSTIAAQLRVGATSGGNYSPNRARNCALRAKKKSGKTRRKLTGELWRGVRNALLLRWSPEQIAGWLVAKNLPRTSHTAIYTRIWADKDPRILRCLRHRGKKYRRRGLPKKRLIPNRTDISQRPVIIEEKLRIGDWEADTIVGARHQGAIVSLVDRNSKFTLLKQVDAKNSEQVRDAIIAKLKPLKNKVLTITYDNGCEFVKHDEVNAKIRCDSYFCTPYHSWERGLNEHTNGLVRQFFPKKTNLRMITQMEVEAVQNLLNNRPRKVLGYKTPAEVFYAK